MMKSRVVRSEEEAERVIAEMEKEGLRVAMVSNCGLPQGHARLTFLPHDCFTNKKGIEHE